MHFQGKKQKRKSRSYDQTQLEDKVQPFPLFVFAIGPGPKCHDTLSLKCSGAFLELPPASAALVLLPASPTKQKCSFTLLRNHKSSLPPPDLWACSNAERCLSEASGRGLHLRHRLWRKRWKLFGRVRNMDFFFYSSLWWKYPTHPSYKEGGETQERQIYYWSGGMRKQPRWGKRITSEFIVAERGSECESFVIQASLTTSLQLTPGFLLN